MKPALKIEQINQLLRDLFGGSAADLLPVQGGEVAQVFSFRAGGQDCILRINTAELGGYFRKEAFIHAMFSSPQIPIPPVIQTGTLDGHAYAVTPRLAGRPLTALPPAEHHTLVPEVIRRLHAIHTRDVSSWSGYGVFDEHGRGAAESWRAFLAAVMEDQEGGLFDRWHALFETTFLERDFFERTYRFLLGRLHRCPEERFLLHGDYGSGNLLVHGGRVSGVLDWINAMYGDFVYDIAWLDFWGRGYHYAAEARAYYESQGMPLQDWQERMDSCTTYIGLNAMRFYALTGSEQGYNYACRVLDTVLLNDPESGARS